MFKLELNTYKLIRKRSNNNINQIFSSQESNRIHLRDIGAKRKTKLFLITIVN